MKGKELCRGIFYPTKVFIARNYVSLLCLLLLVGNLISTGINAQDIVTNEKYSKNNILKIAGISAESLCAGSNINLEFIAKGSFHSDNLFIAQLSNSNGNFDYPTIIGTYSSDMGDQLYAQIPENIAGGNGYRIRIVSTNPKTISQVNSKDITIHEIPNASISIQKPLNVSAATPTILTASEGYFYIWSNGEKTRSITVTSKGQYTVKVANEVGCGTTALPLMVEGTEAELNISDRSSSRDNTVATERTWLPSFILHNNSSALISAYPNPATDHFSLSLNNAKHGRSQVQIMNSEGLVLFQKWIDVLSGYEIMPIHLNRFASGMYFVKLINGKEIQTTKVIIRG